MTTSNPLRASVLVCPIITPGRFFQRPKVFSFSSKAIISSFGFLLSFGLSGPVNGLHAQQFKPDKAASRLEKAKAPVNDSSLSKDLPNESSAIKRIAFQPVRWGRSLLRVFLGATSPMLETKAIDPNDRCHRWRTQVDPLKERIVINESALSDREIEEGIGCLLELKGQKNKARFYGDTRNNYNKSEGFKPPKNPASVEIAALYYASYLFYDNWEHAGSVVLYDEATRKTNTRKIAERAFKSYQEWYKKMLEIGLRKARERKLSPLEGSGISWS